MDAIGTDTLLVGLISFLVIYMIWNSMYKKHNLPPGPRPLPLIGNLLQIERGQLVNSFMKEVQKWRCSGPKNPSTFKFTPAVLELRVSIDVSMSVALHNPGRSDIVCIWGGRKFSKQYGSVYTLYFGSNPVICLSGYDTVKEALIDRGDEFAGRGRLPTLEKVVQTYGITLSDGERWRQIRNFTFRNLREMGFGKKSFEEKIQEEAKNVVEDLNKLKGKPIDVTKLFMEAMSNILFSIVFGSRYEYKDKTFVQLLGVVEETFHIISSPWGQLHTIFPQVMDYIPGPHQKVTSISKKLLSFIKERVRISQETLDPNLSRHFIDIFLIKMEKEKDNPTSEFNERNLLATIHNLFIAGTEAGSSMLRHSLLLLLYYPEVQEKLHMEIDEIIGRDRIPNISDRANMPYTEAVLNEVLRFSDLAPFNVPHMVTKDVEFRGYFLPKGTEVYPLLCTVHRDPTKFVTPYKFNPGHFLDENGKFKKNEGMMAFSAGKRICPGESLAWMEIFLFLTTILQNFKLTSQTRFTEADIAPKMAGFINSPIHYELSFIPR